MIRTLAFLLSLFMTGTPLAATSNRQSIEHAVSALIVQFSDGIAETYSEEPPVIKYGRILDNESDGAVAFFSLDGFGGSNHHVEYVAFFASVSHTNIAGKESHPYRLIAVSTIGARGWRTFNWKSAVIKHSSVIVSGKEMQSGDGLCCPSAPISTTFHVDHFYGSIVETTKRLPYHSDHESRHRQSKQLKFKIGALPPTP